MNQAYFCIFVTLAVVSFYVQCWEEPIKAEIYSLKDWFIALIAKQFIATKQVVVIAEIIAPLTPIK